MNRRKFVRTAGMAAAQILPDGLTETEREVCRIRTGCAWDCIVIETGL